MARSRYRRVRTPEGAKRYGAPIGSIIRVDRDLPGKGKSSKDHPSKDTGEDDGPETGGSTPPPPKDPPAAPPVGPDDDDDGTDDVDPEAALDELLDKSGGVLAPETRPDAEGEAREPRHMDRIDGEEWAAEHWPFTPDNHPFTDTELAAIRGYTDVDFDRWNSDLRGGLAETRSVEGIRNLDAAIDRAPAVPEPVVVSRMIGDAAFADADADWSRSLSEDDLDRLDAHPDRARESRRLLGEYMVGAEHTELGFMSTSVQADGMTDRGFVLRLTVPEGTRGVYVSNPDGPISAAMRQENELILGRGVRYRIDRVEAPEGSDVVELHATVIGQEPESIDDILSANLRRNRRAPAYRGDPDDPSSSAALFDELDEARREGYVEDVAEIEAELRALSPGEHQRGELIRSNRLMLERALARRDVTPEQAIEIANGGLTQFLEDRDVAVSISFDGLAGVLDSGRFLTQHDRGAALNGAASFDPDQRQRIEDAWFGPHGAHPVYGYIRDRSGAPSGADLYGQDRRTREGGASVVLRDSARERASVSVSDSMANRATVFPGPIDAPGAYTARPALAARVASSPEEFAAFLAAGTRPRGSDDSSTPPGFYRDQYVEAQIHGGVGVEDIAQVVFNEPDPPTALIRSLESRGIPWSVRPQNFDSQEDA